jgi:hypothetical protein
MGIQELGNIGEFIAAIATIGTIFYLAVQIRENSRAVKSSSYHQAVEQTWQAVLAVVNNPEIRDIAFRIQNGEELSEKEIHHLNYLNVAIAFGAENILRLREEGLVDEEVWQNFIKNEGGNWFKAGYPYDFLKDRKGTLAARFRQEVQREIEADAAPGST